jgi:peptide-methionine (S)-S-oxide reductase
MATATFAAGCFWGVEAAFREIDGVTDTAVGYTGGTTEHPTYEQVCTDRTGHAEAVRVEYDPGIVSYDRLLDAFWRMHDPTTRDRQGPDVGRQYRSAIFYHDDDQRARAQASVERLQSTGGSGGRRIVTEIAHAGAFYKAEEYHQRYHEKHGMAACRSR